jgi:hypothetical protein
MPHNALLMIMVACLLAWPALAQQVRRPALAQAAHAAPLRSNRPKAIGRFQDWTAAVHQEAGETVCYAFTRPEDSSPPVSGRGDVVLSVTERGASRDVVAISAGFAFSRNAAVSVTTDHAGFQFYTTQRSAFARDGHATVAAFEGGRRVLARSPGPQGQAVSDVFSLRGFAAAHAAIAHACPPPARS